MRYVDYTIYRLCDILHLTKKNENINSLISCINFYNKKLDCLLSGFVGFHISPLFLALILNKLIEISRKSKQIL